MVRIKNVYVSSDASMTIPTRAEDSLEWQLRYGNPESVRFLAASIVGSYSYLLCRNITTKEAIRRLRILRKEYQGIK